MGEIKQLTRELQILDREITFQKNYIYERWNTAFGKFTPSTTHLTIGFSLLALLVVFNKNIRKKVKKLAVYFAKRLPQYILTIVPLKTLL